MAGQSRAGDFLQLGGKVAVVTGGGSGMGRATALAMAEQGMRVAVGDINRERAEETVELARAVGGDAIAIEVDVSDAAAVRRLVATTVNHFGGLDCAANVAGIAPMEQSVASLSEAMWRRIIDVNLTGPFFCLKEQAAAMAGKGGSIVIVASIGALIGSPVQPAYVSSKHGVLGLARSAALEFGAQGIRVNTLCPGFTRTPMTEAFFGADFDAFASSATPLGRGGEPEEMADAILWLCSPRSSFVNGATIVADGGQMVGTGVPGSAKT